jgi:hypothetical protein
LAFDEKTAFAARSSLVREKKLRIPNYERPWLVTFPPTPSCNAQRSMETPSRWNKLLLLHTRYVPDHIAVNSDSDLGLV